MTQRSHPLSSSVGTKLLIAVTGLALFLYLVLHLAGNLLIFAGPGIFNEYSHKLISNPLLVPAEVGLLGVFALHIYKAGRMWFDNRRARPVRYARKDWAGPPSRKSAASSTMMLTGTLTLLFVVLHLKAFKYGAFYQVSDSDTRDLYRLEFEIFSNPLTVGFYVLCMAVIGFHLWHGFSSAFQSLGADSPRYTPGLRVAGKLTAMLIAGGFVMIAAWVYLAGSRS